MKNAGKGNLKPTGGCIIWLPPSRPQPPAPRYHRTRNILTRLNRTFRTHQRKTRKKKSKISPSPRFLYNFQYFFWTFSKQCWGVKRTGIKSNTSGGKKRDRWQLLPGKQIVNTLDGEERGWISDVTPKVGEIFKCGMGTLGKIDIKSFCNYIKSTIFILKITIKQWNLFYKKHLIQIIVNFSIRVILPIIPFMFFSQSILFSQKKKN